MSWSLILDLMVALGAALALGLVSERFRINSIIGYLVAGILVGPGVFNIVSEQESITLIAEIGVALLLFTIGLEFSWRQFRALGAKMLLAAVLSIVALIAVSAGVAMLFGKSVPTAVTLGAIVSLGSTAVVLRVLKDKLDLDNTHGRRALAILLVQDAMLVPLVLLVTFMSQPGEGLVREITGAVLRTGLLTLVLVIVVAYIVPKLLNEKVVARNRELPILLAVGMCMASTWAAHELKISPALGAFVAGTLLADNRFADQMRADVMPLKTLFVTVFFVSIGLLANVGWMMANAHWVLLGAAFVITLKTLITHLSLRAFMPGIVDSLAAALAIAQVGEFSFVLARIGRDGGALGDNLFQGVVAVSLVTLMLTPILTGRAPRIARGIAKRLIPLRKLAREERIQDATETKLRGHIVVVGFGEAGQTTAHTLRRMGEHPVILDMNPLLVREAEQCGYPAFIGDARQAELLDHVCLKQSHGVVVTIPDYQAIRVVVGQCKSLAPNIMVMARARYHLHAAEIDIAGADMVADEEALVGEELAHLMLSQLPQPQDKKA